MHMFRFAGRALAAGGAGFGLMTLSQTITAHAESVDLAPDYSRVWPKAVSLDDRERGPLESKSLPRWFADGTVDSKPTQGGLNGNWKQFRLEEILPINHNSAKFVFSFADPETEYTVPPCSTLELGLKLPDGTGAFRLYTPITPNKTKGGFEVVVKRYDHGCFTPHLFKLKPGQGVWARMKHLKLKYKKGDWDSIGLIAGGTGIAPMLQIIRAVLSDPDDTCKCSLLFTNGRSRDILLKDELDRLEKAHPDRFKVTYVLQQPPLGWEGEVGRITHSMVARTMPPPANPNSMVCVSGPDKMMEIVAGCSMGNTFMWRNTNDNMLPISKAKQVAAPIANTAGGMLQGILFECGYNDGEVYRF